MPDRTPSIAEITALTARLRALSNAGHAADPDELNQFLADKHELLDRITAHDERLDRDPYDGYRTYTPATAAEQLISAGVPPDAARGAVEHYLDALTTARGREPAEGWEIDDNDVTAMLSRHASGAGRPEPVTPSAGAADDEQAGLSRRHADDTTTDADAPGRTDEDAASDEVPW